MAAECVWRAPEFIVTPVRAALPAATLVGNVTEILEPVDRGLHADAVLPAEFSEEIVVEQIDRILIT